MLNAAQNPPVSSLITLGCGLSLLNSKTDTSSKPPILATRRAELIIRSGQRGERKAFDSILAGRVVWRNLFQAPRNRIAGVAVVGFMLITLKVRGFIDADDGSTRSELFVLGLHLYLRTDREVKAGECRTHRN